MMFWKKLFWRRESKTTNFAVIDVASASVGGMILRAEGEEPLEILAKYRAHSNFLLEADFEAFLRVTRGALKEVTQKLLSEARVPLEGVLLVLKSPWFLAETKLIRVEREKPFNVSRSFFEDLVRDERQAFEDRWRQGPLRPAGDSEVIEAHFLKTELNGYQTESPAGKTASQVRSELYLSLAPKAVLDTLQNDLRRAFGGAPKIVVRTFPYLALQVTKGLLNAEEGFLLIDLDGEITELMLIRDRSIEELVSFPRGRNLLLRELVKRFNTFPKEAYSLLERYVRNHLAPAEQEQVITALEAAKDEWCKHFRQAFELLRERAPFPQNIFLLGGDGVGKKFIQCVEDPYFSGFTILGKPFDVRSIMPQTVSHCFAFSRSHPQSHHAHDIFLLFEAVYGRSRFR